VLPMVELCRDLEALAPDAVVFNYTNPVSVLCWAMQQASSIQMEARRTGNLAVALGAVNALAKLAAIL